MAEAKNQMQIADKKTIRQWFRCIENGVPQDKALEYLQKEATSATAPAEYREVWKFFSVHGNKDTNGCLTRAEVLALTMYTANMNQFYAKFNEDCRQCKWEFYRVFTALLQSGLCKLRRKHAQEPLTLQRGLTGCDRPDQAAGDVYMPCFSSASLLPNVADIFGNMKITYETTTGGTVKNYSQFSGEMEILIPPFQAFAQIQTSSQIVYKTDIESTSPFLVDPLIRGSLLGAVVGNCIGAPYEFQNPSSAKELLQNLLELENNDASKGRSRYTVDSCMTLALAESITRVQHFDLKDIKQRFVETLFNDPERNYGASVILVLTELRGQTDGDDSFAPAKRLFNGEGSRGNGGAMRIAPLALYYYFEREDQLNKFVRDATALTHNNPIAINGAILQATAVQFAVLSSVYGGRSDDFSTDYINELIKRMQSIEILLQKPYCIKLEKIKTYLTTTPTEEIVRNELGTGITADTSVPTAIYCFLRGLKPIPGIPSARTEFERTIIYAISLGGDTDTIASMAGAIAGAYYGQDAVTQRWRDLCEAKAIEDAKQYAAQIISQLFWDGE